MQSCNDDERMDERCCSHVSAEPTWIHSIPSQSLLTYLLGSVLRNLWFAFSVSHPAFPATHAGSPHPHPSLHPASRTCGPMSSSLTTWGHNRLRHTMDGTRSSKRISPSVRLSDPSTSRVDGGFCSPQPRFTPFACVYCVLGSVSPHTPTPTAGEGDSAASMGQIAQSSDLAGDPPFVPCYAHGRMLRMETVHVLEALP